MRFLPQTTPDAPPPPPPPTVLSFLSLSPQTFLEVFIFRAETATKLHFTSTRVMFFLLFDFDRGRYTGYTEREGINSSNLLFFVFKLFKQQL